MVRLTFFGDFVSKDPSLITLDALMLQMLYQSDLLTLNFEAPVKTDAAPIKKSGPSICQSGNAPAYLEELGFNVIQLANNHVMDYGPDGVLQTIEAFQKATVIGAGTKDNAYTAAIKDVKGVKVGLISITQKEFGVLDDFSSSQDVGTAWLGYNEIDTIIRETKQKCDILIVLPHAGIENIDVPLPEWRLQYKKYIDWGADAVIASHPHVPQGWEEYKGKSIFYSLGNFYFFKPGFEHASKASEGLCVSLLIHDDKSITTSVYHTRFNDTELCLYDNKEQDKHLCDLINDEDKYNSYLNGQLERLWSDYQLYIMRGLGSVGFKMKAKPFIHAVYGMLKGGDIPMLLNNFQCESHRWAIERILKNNL